MTLNARSQFRASSIATMPVSARRQAGYTMVELVIVVAIIAILSSLAYNSYQDSAIKSRRKAATACMMESAQFLERNYTTTLRYDRDAAGLPLVVPPSNCQGDLAAFFTISVPNATLTQRAYVVQAAPIGIQLAKDQCGTLTLNQTGTKSRSGTYPVDECFP